MSEQALAVRVLIMYGHGAFTCQPLVSNFHLSFEFSHCFLSQFNVLLLFFFFCKTDILALTLFHAFSDVVYAFFQ